MGVLRIHLMLNYYPLIGMVVGVVFMVVGFWRKNDRVKKISLTLFVLVAAFSLPAFVTGEIAGKAEYTGSSGAALTLHKDAARKTIIAIEAVGLVAIVGLILLRRRSDRARWVVVASLILSISACLLAAYTTYLGRQVKWAGLLNVIEKHERTECRQG